jgi:hypothetical protein
MKTLLTIGVERLHHEPNSRFVTSYLAELVDCGGIAWRRGFILSRLRHDGIADIFLAGIDDRIARDRAANRDPLARIFFDASQLSAADQVLLWDAASVGDTATMNRIIQPAPVQNSDCRTCNRGTA